MSFCSSTYKLYSRRLPDRIVDQATKELDLFIEGLEDPRMEYSEELCTYNVHISVHSPRDRTLYGSLANLAADGYENQLKLYKKCFSSPNIRVETVAIKTLLKIKSDLYVLANKPGEKFFLVNLIDKNDVDAHFFEFINSKLRLIQNSGIGFYKEAHNNGYRFRSIIYFQSNYNDCFFRIGDQFYVILYLCQLDGKGYVICKTIKITGNAQINFKNFDFEIEQIKKVDNQFSLDQLSSSQSFDPNEYNVFELKFLKCHAMYVEMNVRSSSLNNSLELRKFIVVIEH
jgi:flavodoxin